MIKFSVLVISLVFLSCDMSNQADPLPANNLNNDSNEPIDSNRVNNNPLVTASSNSQSTVSSSSLSDSSILSSSSTIKIPVIMDSRVVSYKMITGRGYSIGYKYRKGDFILGKDTLKSWFPHMFNDEQIESQCNYFALYFGTSSTFIRYWILSQDMILYEVKPGNANSCPENEDIAHHAMLVCDDKAGTLRESIDVDTIRDYIVPDWDCERGIGEPNVFF